MKKNTKTKKPLFYRFIKSTVGTFYKKTKIIGLENIPDQPSIIVGNHAQLYGPIFCEMYFSKNKSIWVFNNADTIDVYKDTRIITTFKQIIKKLNFEIILLFSQKTVLNLMKL